MNPHSDLPIPRQGPPHSCGVRLANCCCGDPWTDPKNPRIVVPVRCEQCTRDLVRATVRPVQEN